MTITAATPDAVSWRVGNCLTIESTRDAVDAWIAQADFAGHVDVDGLTLTPGDLANMRAALDDAAAQERHDVRLEKLLDRAAQFEERS